MTLSPFLAAAFAFTAREEGGAHTPSPADPNPTLNGVTQSTYDTYCDGLGRPRQSVFLMQPDEQAAIYLAYANESGAVLCPGLASTVALFDAGFNCGTGTAVIFAQHALALTPDGILGPNTKGAIYHAADLPLASSICAQRQAYYIDRVQANPALRPNLLGWNARVVRLTTQFHIP